MDKAKENEEKKKNGQIIKRRRRRRTRRRNRGKETNYTSVDPKYLLKGFNERIQCKDSMSRRHVDLCIEIKIKRKRERERKQNK